MLRLIATLTLAAMSTLAVAAPPAACDLRLAVHFTPDVANPRDPAFLGGLLGSNPGYMLRVHRRGSESDDSYAELQLTGPGPGYLCQSVVDSIRRSDAARASPPLRRAAR
jgi:hypothetical protein